jgi:hypothetical protein
LPEGAYAQSSPNGLNRAISFECNEFFRDREQFTVYEEVEPAQDYTVDLR